MFDHLRSEFSRHFAAMGDRIYLANHSLGRPPDAAFANVERGLSVWPDRMADAWEDDGWPAEVKKFQGLIVGLVGLDDPSLIVPKASAGQGLRAVLNSFPVDRPIKIVTTEGEFDSIDFILKAYREAGRAEVIFVPQAYPESELELYEGIDIWKAIRPGVDLVVISAVYFRTGQSMDNLGEIILKAKSVGALTVIDAYHALGVVPFDMPSLGADYVIGGSYKYLRGGPGASFLAISPQIANTYKTLDTGWFAKQNTFAYEQTPGAPRKQGGAGWMESTPAVLPFYQSTPGIEFLVRLTPEAIRKESLLILDNLRSSLFDIGMQVLCPIDSNEWGAFAIAFHEEPKKACQELESLGIIVDSRASLVRFGVDIFTTEEDIHRTAEACKKVWS